MPRSLTAGLLLFLILLSQGCGSVHYGRVETGADGTVRLQSGDEEQRERILALKKELEGLGPGVREADALLVAESAITVSMSLAIEYRLVSPPLWHNHLVNIGKRDRGLCFHWTKDLMRYLTRLGQASFQFHRGVAHREIRRRYHSTVVVTAIGQPFEEGIVLDPWRDSGRLFWCRVKKDRYPWVPDEQNPPAGE